MTDLPPGRREELRKAGAQLTEAEWIKIHNAAIDNSIRYVETRFVDAIRPAVERIITERMAQAWDEGRAAERRDWEFTFDLSTPDEERQPWPNPYRAALDTPDPETTP